MYIKNILVYEGYEKGENFLILNGKEYLLDDVSLKIWEMIDCIEKIDLEKKVIEYFSGDKNVILEDLNEFIEYLKDNDLIEELNK
ncbi:PqqD family peptide modification chaperone [Mammaliicoccus sciuri]|uniref:PqqD family peptide modification chaperone n=1 Tax=Mammaliicoccus sciuri TaxID=1296 RepID=UPI00379503EF